MPTHYRRDPNEAAMTAYQEFKDKRAQERRKQGLNENASLQEMYPQFSNMIEADDTLSGRELAWTMQRAQMIQDQADTLAPKSRGLFDSDFYK
jgi:hypothetical protein